MHVVRVSVMAENGQDQSYKSIRNTSFSRHYCELLKKKQNLCGSV